MIKEAEALIKKYEKQSENVKNSREFEAINKEIEMQQLEMKLAEKHIKDANEEIAEKVVGLDKAKKNLDWQKKVFSEVKRVNSRRSSPPQKKKKDILTNLSSEAREKVEERLLNSYDRIRANYRNGLAVVPVERDACGGCFNAIPPQRQSEIRQRKKIIVCENCGRILVDRDLFDAVDVK